MSRSSPAAASKPKKAKAKIIKTKRTPRAKSAVASRVSAGTAAGELYVEMERTSGEKEQVEGQTASDEGSDELQAATEASVDSAGDEKKVTLSARGSTLAEELAQLAEVEELTKQAEATSVALAKLLTEIQGGGQSKAQREEYLQQLICKTADLPACRFKHLFQDLCDVDRRFATDSALAARRAVRFQPLGGFLQLVGLTLCEKMASMRAKMKAVGVLRARCERGSSDESVLTEADADLVAEASLTAVLFLPAAMVDVCRWHDFRDSDRELAAAFYEHVSSLNADLPRRFNERLTRYRSRHASDAQLETNVALFQKQFQHDLWVCEQVLDFLDYWEQVRSSMLAGDEAAQEHVDEAAFAVEQAPQDSASTASTTKK